MRQALPLRDLRLEASNSVKVQGLQTPNLQQLVMDPDQLRDLISARVWSKTRHRAIYHRGKYSSTNTEGIAAHPR